MLLKCFLTRLPITPPAPETVPSLAPEDVRVDVREDVRTHLPGEKVPMLVKRVSPTARGARGGPYLGGPDVG